MDRELSDPSEPGSRCGAAAPSFSLSFAAWVLTAGWPCALLHQPAAACGALRPALPVEAQFSNGRWYRGLTTAVREGGLVDVSYEDGDATAGLAEARVRQRVSRDEVTSEGSVYAPKNRSC
jgi:hypothetical protein